MYRFIVRQMASKPEPFTRLKQIRIRNRYYFEPYVERTQQEPNWDSEVELECLFDPGLPVE